MCKGQVFEGVSLVQGKRSDRGEVEEGRDAAGVQQGNVNFRYVCFFPGKNKKRDSWKLYVFGGGEYESESGV